MTSGQGRRPPAEGTLQPSQIIAGKYLVERALGSGGAGLVVAATNVQLGRKVAIKLLHAGSRRDTESVARLIREARSAASIRSEHVVDVLDVGQIEAGSPFVVMEYLEGEDLDARVERAGALPIEEAVGAVQEACTAVAAAHAMGIVHRDIKPANLFSTRDASGLPIIKVLDFGIAKATGPDVASGGHKLTMEGESLGSPLYMSPEQINGDVIDARTDLWSLGVTLYELITAKTPFKANRVGPLYAKIMNDPPDPIRAHRPDVPPELEAVILRCLEKDPFKRYGSAVELAAALTPFAPARRRASVDELLRTTAPQRVLAPPPPPQTGGALQSLPPSQAFAVTKQGGGSKLALFALGGGAVLGLIAFTVFLMVKRAPPSASAQGAASASAAEVATAPPPPSVSASVTAAPAASSAEAPAASASAKPAARKPSLSIKTTR